VLLVTSTRCLTGHKFHRCIGRARWPRPSGPRGAKLHPSLRYKVPPQPATAPRRITAPWLGLARGARLARARGRAGVRRASEVEPRSARCDPSSFPWTWGGRWPYTWYHIPTLCAPAAGLGGGPDVVPLRRYSPERMYWRARTSPASPTSQPRARHPPPESRGHRPPRGHRARLAAGA